ncbi:MAG TPA: hypothetical protein VFN10_16080 [Thermoanaerobaculia bacterium]|nr:hypothetical protein [Thermoanaerobaculia bacterium]
MFSSSAAAQVDLGTIVPLGSNLTVQYDELQSLAQYDVLLRDEEGQVVSFLRTTADARGRVPEQVLFYQSGVVGCSRRTEAHLALPYRFRTFEEAEHALAEHVFTIELYRARLDEESLREEPLSSRRVAFRNTGAPLVYFSNAEGCLLNGVTAEDDVFITARDLPMDGGEFALYVVPAQAHWETADAFADVRSAEPQIVRLDERESRFTTPAWRHGEMHGGAYDVIVRRWNPEQRLTIQPGDWIGWTDDTGIVLEDWDVNGIQHEQIAGRYLTHVPYFEHVDGFTTGSDIWGAIDPRKPPQNNTGYAAWYVVDHQNLWQDGDALHDVSGAVEIAPVKGGCINATRTLIWPHANPSQLTPAQPSRLYDVVLDFGTLSQNGVFTSNKRFDAGTDIVDDRAPGGFALILDPTQNGAHQTASWDLPQQGVPADKNCTVDLLGHTLQWSDPPFFGNDVVNVAFDDDDEAAFGSKEWSSCSDKRFLDMRARVWAPVVPGTTTIEAGKFPVVVILHGQQFEPFYPGYAGYDWLGDFLASNGFIVYSIDGRSTLNASDGSRGEMIREHLRKLVKLNAAGSGSLLSQHLDLDRVTLIGHSRGGDAIIAAEEWDRVQPDNTYKLRALIALAPTNTIGGEKGWPVNLGDHPPHLRNIPYLVFQGSYDGDTTLFPGLSTYDQALDRRAPGTSEKAMVYVLKANHNWLNTVWEQLEGNDSKQNDVISATLERETAKVYVRAALEAWINGRREYVELLRGVIPNPTAATVVVDHQFANSLIVDDTQNGNDPYVSSSNGAIVPIGFQKVATWEGKYSWPNVVNYFSPTNSTWLQWQQEATYTLEITKAVAMKLMPSVHEALALRIGQIEGKTNWPNIGNLWFEVRLIDENGAASDWIESSWFDTVPFTFPDVKEDVGSPTVMSIVRIPLDAFTGCSNVDITRLAKLQLRFGKQGGEVLLDDIRFTP